MYVYSVVYFKINHLRYILAERVGFEPTLGFPKPDFESGAFDHSATSPICVGFCWRRKEARL